MDRSLDALRLPKFNLHEVPELKEIYVRDEVILRPMETDDAIGLLRILDTDPTIRDRVSVASRMYSLEDVSREVEVYKGDANTIRYTLLEGGKPIGLVSFWRDIDNSFDAPDNPNDYGFGYFLDPADRGSGLIPEAVQQVMNIAQTVLHIEGFIAYCEDNNPNSISVLTKLGFQPTNLTYKEQENGWIERKYIKDAL